MIKEVFNTLEESDETAFLTAYLMPFASEAQGVRFPQSLPYPTLAYTTYHEKSVNMTGVSDIVMQLTNYESVDTIQGIMI